MRLEHPLTAALRIAGLAASFLLPGTRVAAQTPASSPDPAQRLTSLLAAQQAAVNAGDPGPIVSTSTPLAALALRLVAQIDFNSNQLASTVDLLTQSLRLDSQPDTSLLLLTADLRSHRPAEARAVADSMIQTITDSGNLRFLLAQRFQAEDDLDDAIRQLQKAIALDPGRSATHLALGLAFWQLNEYQYNEESLAEFTAARHLDPASYLANFNLGAVLSQYHRFAEAASSLALAATADPASPDPSLQLGMNLYIEGNTAEARPALERAVALTGADVARNNFQIRRALAILSRIDALEGRLTEARRLDRQADIIRQQMLAGGIAPALSESTGLIVGGPARSAAAPSPPANPTPPQTSSASLRPQLLTIAASSLNDAGTALARTRDYSAALPLFREASTLDPALPPVLRNLGLAAVHVGALDEAIPALTRAIALDPSDSIARRYLDQARAARAAPPSTP